MVAVGWDEDWNWDRDGYFICRATAFLLLSRLEECVYVFVDLCACQAGKGSFFVLFYGLLFVLGFFYFSLHLSTSVSST